MVENQSDQLIGISDADNLSDSEKDAVPIMNGQGAEAFAHSWMLPEFFAGMGISAHFDMC